MRKIIGLMLAAAIGCAASQVEAQGGVEAGQVGEVALVNSGAAAAQLPFRRGLALLHNFEYERAAEAFREAQQADPGFAMAYWGEAMTYNHPLWMEQDAAAARAVLARLAPTAEGRAAAAGSPRERAWLGAVEALYGEGGKRERDHAYSMRMQALFAADPEDVNARSFAALALMGLAHDGRDFALYMRAAGMLEEVWSPTQRHPGVLHYLIHAYDDPVHAPLGIRAARVYGEVAPDAGHALHMTSHIFIALGQWDEVERVNRQAIATVNAQRAGAGKPPVWCGHYPEWLVYGLWQKGGDAADEYARCRAQALGWLAAGKDATQLGAGRSPFTSWTDMALRRGIETGAWPEPVNVAQGHLLGRFNLATARVLGLGAKPAEMRAGRDEMRALAAQIAPALKIDDPDNTYTMPWIERALAQADALILLEAGKRDEAIAALRAAAAAEAALPVEFGPPPLAKPGYELLGDVLLAAGDQPGAATAYRAQLARTPGRRLSVAGLAASAGPRLDAAGGGD